MPKYLGQTVSRERRLIIKLIELFFNFERLGVNWSLKIRALPMPFTNVTVVTATRILEFIKFGQ